MNRENTDAVELNKRVTLSLSKKEWGFLHMLRSLYTLADPVVASTPGYNEIIKGMVYEVANLVSLDNSIAEDFVQDRHTYLDKIEKQSPDSSDEERKIILSLQEINKDIDREYDKIANRWENSAIFPKGNYVINLEREDHEIINFLQNKILNIKKDMKLSPSKIIKKCVLFIKTNAVFSRMFLRDTFIANLYGVSLTFSPKFNFLKTSNSKEIRESLIGFDIYITNSDIERIRECQKDETILINLAEFFIENGPPKNTKEYETYAGRFWSLRGFDLFSAISSLGIAMRILTFPNLWLPDFVYNSGRRKGLRYSIQTFFSGISPLMARFRDDNKVPEDEELGEFMSAKNNLERFIEENREKESSLNETNSTK